MKLSKGSPLPPHLSKNREIQNNDITEKSSESLNTKIPSEFQISDVDNGRRRVEWKSDSFRMKYRSLKVNFLKCWHVLPVSYVIAFFLRKIWRRTMERITFEKFNIEKSRLSFNSSENSFEIPYPKTLGNSH